MTFCHGVYTWKRAFTGERAVSSESLIKFNFFATRMSESQSDCFFSMLEHAIVPNSLKWKPALIHG